MVHLRSNLWVVDVALSSTRNLTDPLSHSLFFDTSKLAFGHTVGTGLDVFSLIAVHLGSFSADSVFTFESTCYRWVSGVQDSDANGYRH